MKWKISMALFIFALVMPWPSQVINTSLILNLVLAPAFFIAAIFCRSTWFIGSFPGVLLSLHLFMLAVNVGATRVILQGQGFSIKVVEALGSCIVENRPATGLLIYALLVMLRLIVSNKACENITNMAGKLNLEPECIASASLCVNFWREMNGYVVFVKNSVLAGILISLTNLLGGIAISTIMHGMELDAAFQSYSHLTVGIGIAALLQSLILELATGIFCFNAGKDRIDNR